MHSIRGSRIVRADHPSMQGTCAAELSDMPVAPARRAARLRRQGASPRVGGRRAPPSLTNLRLLNIGFVTILPECSSSPKPRPLRSVPLSSKAASCQPQSNCAGCSQPSPTPRRPAPVPGPSPAGSPCPCRCARSVSHPARPEGLLKRHGGRCLHHSAIAQANTRLHRRNGAAHVSGCR